MKRMNQSPDLRVIIPLVGIYNNISLRYTVHCGDEDLEPIVGNLYLRESSWGRIEAYDVKRLNDRCDIDNRID